MSPLEKTRVVESVDARDIAYGLFEKELAARSEGALRRPSVTYRLQLHKGFGFEKLDAVVDYLFNLGISDVYLSPYLTACAGSTHGYDVIDHSRINPEIGDKTSHEKLLAHLKVRGIGRVLDIVPNHMGFSAGNSLYEDVLENGPQACSAAFFDIDWNSDKQTLNGRILLPVLETDLESALASGKIVLERDGGSFWIRYQQSRFPLRPRSYARVLGHCDSEFRSQFSPDDEDVREFLSLRDAADSLPNCPLCTPEESDTIRREKERIKQRLGHLCTRSDRLRRFLNDRVSSFQGKPGDLRSFADLHHLVNEQAYSLAHWRAASADINYRRFFDVSTLAGIRVEDPEVFDRVHRLILEWVAEGGVTALRVDHPDGLADPLGYFQRLQEALFLIACRAHDTGKDADSDWNTVSLRLVECFREEVEKNPNSPLARRFPIVAEKILSTGETLPADWPVDGTVGYEYLNALNGLFVHPRSSGTVGASYRAFTGDSDSPADALRSSKLFVERNLLASEVSTLTKMLQHAVESRTDARDFKMADLHRVLSEVIANLGVYRTYRRSGEEMSSKDRESVETAIDRSRKRLPDVDTSLFDFLRDVLCEPVPLETPDDDRRLREQFVTRFQQTSGPVQAKGLEDTTFYRQVPLVSLNEVGGDPSLWGTSPSSFHVFNSQRLAAWPGGFSTTATHDTKRGEDARIRINVISELDSEWTIRVNRWSVRNSSKKTKVKEIVCPDLREEYLLYETLLGAWPMEFGKPSPPSDEFIARIQAYMVKAASEAKRNTTWTDPDSTYKERLTQFVADILVGAGAEQFLDDFCGFQQRVARVGVVHSLAQVLLKVASPGVADLYQGSEFWDLNLVDPDNRRPVDYETRASRLAWTLDSLNSGRSRATLVREMWRMAWDGAIKQYVVWATFNERRVDPELYLRGSYVAVEAAGTRQENVVAFERCLGDRHVLAVAPRLVAGLMGEDGSTLPIGVETWGDTEVALSDSAPLRWRNRFTDEVVEAFQKDNKSTLRVADVFAVIPLGLLVGESI